MNGMSVQGTVFAVVIPSISHQGGIDTTTCSEVSEFDRGLAVHRSVSHFVSEK